MRALAVTLALALSAVGAPALAQAPAKPVIRVAQAPVTAAAPATATAPIDPEALALASDILTAAFPPEKREQLFSSTLDSIVDQTRKTLATRAPVGDKDFQVILDHSIQRQFDQMKTILNGQIPDIYDSMAHAYARMFSKEDLTQILAFVKTPAGQHYFQQATAVLKDPDVQAANQRMLTQLLAKLPDLQGQTMQEIEDYLAKKEKQQKASHASHAS
jgi:hypothetical protein